MRAGVNGRRFRGSIVYPAVQGSSSRDRRAIFRRHFDRLSAGENVLIAKLMAMASQARIGQLFNPCAYAFEWPRSPAARLRQRVTTEGTGPLAITALRAFIRRGIDPVCHEARNVRGNFGRNRAGPTHQAIIAERSGGVAAVQRHSSSGYKVVGGLNSTETTCRSDNY